MGLEVLLQGEQDPLGLLHPFRTESSGALRGLQGQLQLPQELRRLFDGTGVASQKLSGLRNVHLQHRDNPDCWLSNLISQVCLFQE